MLCLMKEDSYTEDVDMRNRGRWFQLVHLGHFQVVGLKIAATTWIIYKIHVYFPGICTLQPTSCSTLPTLAPSLKILMILRITIGMTISSIEYAYNRRSTIQSLSILIYVHFIVTCVLLHCQLNQQERLVLPIHNGYVEHYITPFLNQTLLLVGWQCVI
jgi:hypothetical protein